MGQRVVIPILVALLPHFPVNADDSAMYEAVAQYVGVPTNLLYAMALTESGLHKEGRTTPWPWTLNIEGEAHRYESREAMFDGLMGALQAGRTRVDIGPMQVNWYWQYDKLSSPWTITDPTDNVKTGAAILRAHFEETGDWWEAVGRYHRPSQEPQHKAAALAYAGRVKKAMRTPDVEAQNDE